jgi:hypothetical protein
MGAGTGRMAAQKQLRGLVRRRGGTVRRRGAGYPFVKRESSCGGLLQHLLDRSAAGAFVWW